MNYTIKGIELHQTCGACPEQYEAYNGNERVGYLRLRHGHFTVEVPDCGGTLVYEAEPVGDGLFMPDEREKYLTKAVDAIIGWRLIGAPDRSSYINKRLDAPMLHEIKTREDYEKLKASGMMWEWFPDFTGIYELDIPQEVNPRSDAGSLAEEIQMEKEQIAYWKETACQWECLWGNNGDESLCLPPLVDANAKLKLHKTRLEYLTRRTNE